MTNFTACAQLDNGNYNNTNSNKARLKVKILESDLISIDSLNNEFIIGSGVKRIRVTADIMTEQLTTYLYLILQHRKSGQNYNTITQSLVGPHNGYGGGVVTGVINVSEGDRISVIHECTAIIRGKYSQVIVEAID